MKTVISADGTPIAYDRSGSGDPLILVGGAFSYRRFPAPYTLWETTHDPASDPSAPAQPHRTRPKKR